MGQKTPEEIVIGVGASIQHYWNDNSTVPDVILIWSKEGSLVVLPQPHLPAEAMPLFLSMAEKASNAAYTIRVAQGLFSSHPPPEGQKLDRNDPGTTAGVVVHLYDPNGVTEVTAIAKVISNGSLGDFEIVQTIKGPEIQPLDDSTADDYN